MAEVVNLRWMHEGHVESAHPVYLLADTAETITTFEPGGSIAMHSSRPKGGPRGRNLLPGTPHTGFEPGTWTGEGVLRVHRSGQPWSTWRWLSAGRTWSEYWYVNLEEPWLRTQSGFDTEDWILDVLIAGDLSWRYKDEDELAWATASGRFDEGMIERIWSAAHESIAVLEAREWPFGADWDAWLPPERRSVPALQSGWDAAR